jgi:hypothetical protein
MRLTLATLLAYLDNVLEPADAQVLSEKIEKSDFASGLVMRIKSISRKLRMSAPKVDGKGLGRDPNSVAEYLDGSLAPERIGEFERLCLESDVQLAEVASCHQILAMVLNKPADVPAQMRERAYDLGNGLEAARQLSASRIDGAHKADGQPSSPPLPPKPSSASTSASMLAMPSDSAKTAEPVAPPVAKEPQVPDYLRGAQATPPWKWLAALAAVFLIALTLLRLMGPFDGTHPVARALGLGSEVAVVPQPNPAPQLNSNQNPNPVPTPVQPVVTPMPNDNVPPVPADQRPPVVPPGEPVPVEPMPRPVPPPVNPVEDVPPRPGTPPPVPVPVETVPVEPVKPAPVPVEPVPVEPKAAEPKPLPVVAFPALPLAPPPNPSAMMDLGRYTSDEQVIARLVMNPEAKTNLWHRLAPRSMLVAGERLVVLPTYRPQLTLANGVQVTVVGESSLSVEKPTQAGSASLVVDYGRIWLASLGAAGGQVELDLGGLKGVVALADADAAIAIEVRRVLPPGARAEDPAVEAIRVVDLFATGGRVVWQANEAQAVEIPAAHVAIYVAEELPRLRGPFELPTWTDVKNLPDIERRASLDMEAELPLDKPLDIALAEHAGGRRVEIRSLAARSLAALDQFEAILAELNDPRQYSYWAAEIDTLRFALSRNPKSAARVLSTLQNQRPENAKVIYEMLLGASDEQLVSGSAATLVKSLESNETDVRVVSLDSLRRITGLMLMYRPEKQLASNATSIQKWKEKLKDNLITNRLPPSPLNEYKPAEER